MNIKTGQIIEQIELVIKKSIEELTEEDINSVEELTINEFNIVGEKEDFFIDDLLLFRNLKSITFNNKIIDTNIMQYVLNSGIEELDLYNCELIYEFEFNFENINKLGIEYVDNFKEEDLVYFPNVTDLVFRGYDINKELSKNINKLDILNSTIEDIGIIENSSIIDLYISNEEYERHKEFYSNAIIKVNVYDDNNCYLLNSGDDYE